MPSWQDAGMYGADLAAFHAAHRTALAREAATSLVDELAEANLHRGLVADIGCGDGTLAALLIEAGYDVLAVDPSPDFLALVDRLAPTAQRMLSTLSRVRLPSGLVGIACVGEALSHDLIIDLDETIESFHRSLRPRGVLILDVPGPGRHADRQPVIEDHDDGLLITHIEEEGFRLRRRMTVFTTAGGGRYRRSDEAHELRLYEPADVRSALSRAGFVAIRQLERYGASGPTFDGSWAGFIAERP